MDSIDEVAVIIVDDEDIFVIACGWGVEWFGLVGEDAAGGLKTVRIDEMGALHLVNVGIIDVVWGGVGFLGGADVASLGV